MRGESEQLDIVPLGSHGPALVSSLEESGAAFTSMPPPRSDQLQGLLCPQWQGGGLVSPLSPPHSGPSSVPPWLLFHCPWLLTARRDRVSELSRSPLLDPGLGTASAQGGRWCDTHPASFACRGEGTASSLGLSVCVTSRQGPGGREGQRAPRGGHASRPAAHSTCLGREGCRDARGRASALGVLPPSRL